MCLPLLSVGIKSMYCMAESGLFSLPVKELKVRKDLNFTRWQRRNLKPRKQNQQLKEGVVGEGTHAETTEKKTLQSRGALGKPRNPVSSPGLGF